MRTSSGPTDSRSAWALVEEGFQPAREHEIESLFAVANGYVGTRGSLQEGGPLSQPATFVAGVFDRPPGSTPELVVAPDWARLSVCVEGEELRLGDGKALEHRRALDMRRGLFEREWRQRDGAGRVTRLKYTRFASLADRHALVESLTLTPENYSGRVSVESVVEGDVANADGVVHLEPVEPTPTPSPTAPGTPGRAAGPLPLLVVRTIASGVVLAFASSTTLQPAGAAGAEHTVVRERDLLKERWDWEAEIGVTYQIDKLVSVYTSRDVPDSGQVAVEHLSEMLARGADAILSEHERAWAEAWEAADVVIDGDEEAQRAVRFAIYHLISAANPDDERVSIGARGLAGESYKGHVFWEVEIYLLPFYVFTHPPAARALLMYRYHTLPGALAKARAMGYRGALFAWESTDTGEEASPMFAVAPDGEVVPILTGRLEQHVSADVAHGVWQYWQTTGDDDFFVEAGAEILVETARFWASRVTLGDDGLYHILGVIGPDEYHEAVDDDAYTNGMASFSLEKAAEAVGLLRTRWPERWTELSKRLAIAPEEPREWLDVAARMYTGLDPATGIVEQFRGYFALDYVDLSAYEPRTAPMDVILGRDRIARTQIIKQPDVVLLIYLLWDRYPPEVRQANFRYYDARCGHGSSLSPSIHAAVAARLGDVALAERYFRQSAEIDLADNMGNAAGGVHIAALAGLWQATTCGAAGMRLRGDGLSFDPHLLPRWQALRFRAHWRGRRLRIAGRAAPPTAEVRLERGDPMVVAIGEPGGPLVVAEQGKRYRAEARGGGWQPWKEEPVS